jgi:hypothetical protein
MAYDPDKELARKIRDKQISQTDAAAQIKAMNAGTYIPPAAPVSAPAAPAITPATPAQTGLVGLRDIATQSGLSVDWNKEQGVLINGTPISTQGLTNYEGTPPAGYQANTYYGTQEQVNSLLSPYIQPQAPTQNPQIQAALADYQKWAAQPYVSQYAPQIESVISQIMTRQFNYDPAKDAQAQLAIKEMTRNVLETMNSRGILNSTITENQVQQGVADLLPQYQQIARQQFQDEGQLLMSQVDMLMGVDETQYGRYQDEGQKLGKVLDVVMQMDETQYQRWTDAYERRNQVKQDEIAAAAAKVEADRQKVKDMYEKWDNDGYAKNDVALFFGVDPGTLNKSAREAKVKREQELEDKAISLKNQKEMADYQYNLSKKLAAQKEASTATVETLGTEAQVGNYYALRDIYFGGKGDINKQYVNNPLAAYNQLMADPKRNIALVGQKLYNKLLTELTSSMKVQKDYEKTYAEEPVDYSKDPTYTAEMDLATRDPEGWLENYNTAYQDYYDAFTYEGASKLAQAAQAQIEKNKSGTESAKYKEYYTLAETNPKEFKKKLEKEKATIIDEVGIENYEKLKAKLE